MTTPTPEAHSTSNTLGFLLHALFGLLVFAYVYSSPVHAATLVNEGFESGLGIFSQSTADNMDWTWDSAGTPSSSTGPSSGSNGSTYYMYTEASSNSNKIALLKSSAISLSGYSAATLSFDYHMYGADMGTLEVQLSSNGSSFTTVWSKSGNQNNSWYTQNIDLSSYLGGNLYIQFKGTTGSNYRSDMAIDNIVVDATAIVSNQDFGDAPDASNGTASGNYQTRSADNGPRHTIIPNLMIGSQVDADNGSLQNTNADADDSNGADDEDGLINTPIVPTTAGQNYTLPVYIKNETGETAYLTAYIDFNRDGDFLDAGEKADTQFVYWSGYFYPTFTLPSGLTAGTLYARLRLSKTKAEAETPVGAATSGEVEDHKLTVSVGPYYDFGDAPASYGEARHTISNSIRLGDNPADAETASYYSYNASGDNYDEDGAPHQSQNPRIALFPILKMTATSYSVDIKATNTTGSVAKLYGWIDFDHNGSFQADEAASVSVPNNTNGTVTLTWNSIPTDIKLGTTFIRLRLTTDSSITTSTPAGNASNGEVEDYPIAVAMDIPPDSPNVTIVRGETPACSSTVFTDNFDDLPVEQYFGQNASAALYTIRNWTTTGGGNDTYAHTLSTMFTSQGTSVYFGNGFMRRIYPDIGIRPEFDGNGKVLSPPDAIELRDDPDDTTPGVHGGEADWGPEPVKLSRTFSTVAGQKYRLYFAAIPEDAGSDYYGSGIMRVDTPSGSIHFKAPGGMEGIQHYRIEFTATGSSSTISFVNYGHIGTDGGWCDPSSVISGAWCTVGGAPISKNGNELIIDDVTVALASACKTSNITGFVYADKNGNNAFDTASENGLGNITVTLYDNNGTTNTTTDDLAVVSTSTAANGSYSFSSIGSAQHYRIEVDSHDADLPASANIGTTNPLADVTVTDGTTLANQNFGFDLGCNASAGQFGGIVFRDYNQNGIRDLLEEGIAGVTVKAYDDTNTAVATATTDVNGWYALNGLTNGAQYRLEYTGLPAGLASGAHGTDSATNTRFITASDSCNTHYGVSDPVEYCQADPYVAANVFVNGAPSAASVGTYPSIHTFPYTATGPADAATPPASTKASIAQTGALWGLAYQKSTKTLFASAAMRRFSGLGSLGTGGIYKVDMSNPTANTGAASYIDVRTIGIPTGSDARNAADSCNSLATGPWTAAHDLSAWDMVGKVGIGDIDYDETNNRLWLVNLNDRKLYGIRNISPATAPTASDVLGGYAINLPSPYSCSSGTFRPWAVKYHRGYVYVGGVCDAASAPYTLSNVRGYVLKFDPANIAAGFAYVKDFAIDQPRYRYSFDSPAQWNGWIPQADAISWPYFHSPIVGDLEFDTDGSIIVGIIDRAGLQNGNGSYDEPTCSDTGADYTDTLGDILRLCKTDSGYLTDSEPGCTTNIPLVNKTSNEYYWGDHGPNNNAWETMNEIASGGLALAPGKEQVLMSGYDVNSWGANGIAWLNNKTGAADNRYSVSWTTFGKSTGMGELEVLCDSAPIEIGNRVWLDNDKDGIQDPNETGVSNVSVKLTCGGDSVTATTNTDGEYYFSNTPGGNAVFMDPGESCSLSIDSSQASLDSYTLTAQNADGQTDNNASSDIRDSDAADNAGTAKIDFTVGSHGQNNHSLDFGYHPTSGTGGGTIAATTICNATEVSVNISGLNSGSDVRVNLAQGAAGAQSWIKTADASGVVTFKTPRTSNSSYTALVRASSEDKTAEASAGCPAIASNGNITGVAFRDFNANGVLDTGATFNEVGVAGITVKAFDADDPANTPTATATTDVSGNYSLTGLTDGVAYRIEFSNLPVGNYSTRAPSSSMQFHASPASEVNFGIVSPQNYYSGSNSEVLTSIITNGDQSSGTERTLVSIPYNASAPWQGDVSTQAVDTSTGSVYGIAYQPQTDRIFTSAYLKRHAGLGPAGLDAIYVTKRGSNSPSVFVELKDDLGIDVGTIGSNASRGLGDKNAPSHDVDAFNLTGTVGIGDIDISADGETLYVTNLYDKTLYAIKIDSDGNPATRPTPADVTAYPIPVPTLCSVSTAYTNMRINMGGERYEAADAEIWMRSSFHLDGQYGSVSNAVDVSAAGAAEETIYQTFWDYVSKIEVPLPNGTYTIKLHYADFWGSPTGRNFDINFENGQLIDPAFNIYNAAGGNGKAVVKSYDITVNDGMLNIDFTANKQSVLISGMEIIGHTQVPAGNWRPFAIGVEGESVFVGGVCDAATSQNPMYLRATVYQLDNNTGTFQQALSTSLDYNRGVGYSTCDGQHGWFGWLPANSYPSNCDYSGNIAVYPQPILSDIEFAADRSMLLGFRDRFGDQVGQDNYTLSGTTTMTGSASGDVLRASWSGGSYHLENNATVANLTSGGTNNLQGPGGGEFYYQDNYKDGHAETSLGGLASHKGFNQLLYSRINPEDTVRTAGIGWLNNTTGEQERGYMLYDQSAHFLGKAAGLGDVEIVLEPAPVEIGDRVWLDTDGDGIQDADENGIPGVNVTLLAADGITELATATTNADGTYYFSSGAGTATNSSTVYGLSTLKPKTAYKLKFPTTVTVSGTVNNLTTVSAGSNRELDSSASANGIVSIATLDLPATGAHNYSFDVGYTTHPPTLYTNNYCVVPTDTAAIPGLLDPTDMSRTIISGPGTYSYPNRILPGYGTVDVTVKLDGGTDAQHSFNGNLSDNDQQQSWLDEGLTDGRVGGIYISPDAGKTASITFDFDQPTGNVDLIVFDVDGQDVASITAKDENGDPITDFSGWRFRSGDLSNFVKVYPIAPLPIWDSAASTLTSSENINDNRSFALLTPDKLVTQITVSMTGPSSSTVEHIYATLNSTLTGRDGEDCSTTTTGSISGTVYTDSNGNNSYDFGTESGIGSVTVTLKSDASNSAIASTTTAADGSYSFTKLDPALTYRIQVDTLDTDLPAGAAISTTNPLTGIAVTAGGTTTDQDFGFSISYDRSDTPISYGEAMHTIVSGIQLGSTIDKETVSIASADASGDGSDDDGISIPVLTQGNTATITATVSGAGGYLQGWIDWNGDGDFADAGEQVATDLRDNQAGDTDNTSGIIKFTVNVPTTATTSQTFARFRWSTTQGLNATAAASNGEVEDYALSISFNACLAPTADNAWADELVEWMHNADTPPGAAADTVQPYIRQSTYAASASTETFKNLSIMVKDTVGYVTPTSIPSSVSTSKYIAYDFKTPAFTGTATLYGIGLAHYDQLSGAYKLKVQVDTDPAFGSPTTLINSIGIDDTQHTLDADAPTSSTLLPIGWYYFNHYQADQVEVLAPNTTYYVRVYPYNLTRSRYYSAFAQNYAIYDDFTLKVRGCGTGAISGTVYLDSNSNNSYDSATETGLSSITVTLLDDANGTTIATANTTADGSYNFSGLSPSLTYRLSVSTTDTDLPVGSTIGTTNPLTGVAVTAGGTTSNKNFGFDPDPGKSLSGKVFEDVNYGSGAGRAFGAAGSAGVNSARVELYGASGAFISSATTASDGSYTFKALPAGNYYVRAVNSTVKSTRAGSTGAELGIQTFRTDGSTPVTNEVGGRKPANIDSSSNTTSQTLNTSTFVLSGGGQAQSVQPVTMAASNISGVDFGFNFSTVVNTNDSGQGSLRQAITNANLLANTGLAQTGQDNTYGIDTSVIKEVLLFNIPASQPGYTDPDGVANNGDEYWSIQPVTALPGITQPVIIDGSTQPGTTCPKPRIEINGSLAGANVDGIGLYASNSTIKGLIVNSFKRYGILLSRFPINFPTSNTLQTRNTVECSYVGTDASGLLAKPNLQGGISAEGDSMKIGGTTPAKRNIISGNGAFGIYFYGGGSTNGTVQGNYIGVGADSTTALGNGGFGIGYYNTSGTGLIGGTTGVTINGACTGACNIIANNTSAGVGAFYTGPAAMNVKISANSIHSNGGIGIDLERTGSPWELDGVNPNDAQDVDSKYAPNGLQNYPVLTAVETDGATTNVTGTLNSNVSTDFTIEFFVSDNADSTGYGEGARYLGSTTVTTDTNGDASFSVSLPAVAEGMYVTSTATNSTNNTSEFSGSTVVTPPKCSLVVTTTADSNNVYDNSGSLRDAIECANTTPGVDSITFNIPNTEAGFINPDSIANNGNEYWSIALNSQLPDITEAVTIDGRTQTSSKGNTNAGNVAVATTVGVDNVILPAVAAPEIELVGQSFTGFDIKASNVKIYGMGIRQFDTDIRMNQANTSGILFSGMAFGVNAVTGADPGAGKRSNQHIAVDASNVSFVLTNSVLGYNDTKQGIVTGESSTLSDVSATISGNHFVGVGQAGNSNNAAIEILRTQNPKVSIIGNHFDGLGKATATDLAVEFNDFDGGNATCVTCLVENNDMSGFHDGVGYTSNASLTGLNISKNRIHDNAVAGVLLSNTLNATVSQNYLYDNGKNGVLLSQDSAKGNIITQNRIYNNGEVGINLNGGNQITPGGITLNDANDTDTGPNNLLNFPVLQQVTLSNGTVTARGCAPAGSVVEFFEADVSPGGAAVAGANRFGLSVDYGEGQTYLGGLAEGGAADTDNGSCSIQGTDGNNHSGMKAFQFSVAAPASLAEGDYLTATATTATTGTSEFGPSTAIIGGPPTIGSGDCSATGGSDILFIVDNSGSITPAEYTDFANTIQKVGAQLLADNPANRIAVAHFGGPTDSLVSGGQYVYIERDFSSAAMTAPVRQFGTNGAYNTNWWADHLAGAIEQMRYALDGDASTTSSYIVSPVRETSRNTAAPLQIVLMTDAVRYSDLVPNDISMLIDPAGSGAEPDDGSNFTIYNQLKSEGVSFSVVSFNPNATDIAASAAIASVGGTYTGTIETNPKDPEGSQATPRRFISVTSGFQLTTAQIEDIAEGTAICSSTISGTVFEDVNYGGGNGRAFGTAGTVGVAAGATVEVYDSKGAYVASTSTGTGGSYKLPNLPDADYYIRVVSDTVNASRSGSNGAEVPVPVYRSNGTAAIANEIGGRKPSAADAGTNTGSSVLDTSTLLFSGSTLAGKPAQAVQLISLTGSSVKNADFGFNFDTIVNTNDSGQGSLRQFLANANLLGDDASLAQEGRTAGTENAIFMLPVNDPRYNSSGNYWNIALQSQLPNITNQLVLDGSTQSGFISSPVLYLDGTNAGAANGLTFGPGSNNSLVKSLAIKQFGGAGILLDGATNTLIGGTANGAGNIITGNTGDGVAVTGNTTQNNAILGNSIYSNGGLGIDLANDGVTPNDVGDADSGPNNLLNFPDAQANAFSSNGTKIVTYDLDLDMPVGNYRLEFFVSNAKDPSGNGEGQTYIGYKDIVHNGLGSKNYKGTFNASQTVASGAFISSTITFKSGANSFGPTSEFSGIKDGIPASVCTDLVNGVDGDMVIDENSKIITLLEAHDANGNPITYVISGGTDSSLFTVTGPTSTSTLDCSTVKFLNTSVVITKSASADANTRAIVPPGFLLPPGDYEIPQDSNGDNIYNFQITAIYANGKKYIKDMSVQVADVNEAPVITSAAEISYNEDSTAKVIDIASQDPDAGTSEGNGLTYSITGGADAAYFTIAPVTGIVKFRAVPDYDAPMDTDRNNVYELEVTVTDSGGLSGSKVFTITIVNNTADDGVLLQTRAFLQGPYNAANSLMNADLQPLGLLPVNQPYTVAPFSYNGTETLSTMQQEATGNNAVVDWVLVELRSTLTDIVARRAVILQRDGDLVDAQTGSADLHFASVKPGNYYVSVRHRNHLDLISASPVALSATSKMVDFSKSATAVRGSHSRLESGSAALMWAGDINGSQTLTASGPGNDVTAMLSSIITAANNTQTYTNYIQNGYLATDINLDGKALFTGPGNDSNLLVGNILLHPANTEFAGNYIVRGSLSQ